ncbi:MAG: RIP metalloprotease RseP [Chitinophagaceae bacterium]|nr:RIP metalloprotease RseP [Chitinophagaceae bacterium]
MLLAIDWSTVGIKAAQFILSFSILILLHELGHFLPAKWFKCRVEKFYLFFNPWFSLFKKKKGDTEYGIGWIPLGGYVKISGMIDESMDKEQMKEPAQPYEFRSKPAWQRLIIMLGGVTVNVILAIIIFIFILWIWGKEYLPPAEAKYGITTDSLSQSIGLRDGDIILKVDTTTVEDIFQGQIRRSIVLNEAQSMTVKRGDSVFNLPLPAELVKQLNTRKATAFTGIRFPSIVDSFAKDSKVAAAGVQIGDQFIGVNGKWTPYNHEFRKAIAGLKDTTIQVALLRNSDTIQVTLPLNKKGQMGLYFQSLTKLGFQFHTKEFSFFEAVPAGFKECWSTLGAYVTGLKQLFTGKAKASESLGSVLSIGGIFPGVWDWQSFWQLTAIFSIILAFMNVLPIPALDGGHALFTLIEMITGRKPSDKFMEYAQMVGMVLLLGLMAYAMGLDIWRIFK